MKETISSLLNFNGHNNTEVVLQPATPQECNWPGLPTGQIKEES